MLNDKNICYVLGFIWADGHVNKKQVSITVKSSDFNTIYDIVKKSFTTSTYHRKKYLKQTGKYYNSSTITINDVKFKQFLIDNDFMIKSNTSPNKILKNITSDNIKHFLRGYIDGDGSFSIYNNDKTVKFNITSNVKQNWNFVEKILNDIEINKYKIHRYYRKTGNSSCVSISNKWDIIKIGDFIYKDSENTRFERKYNKYIDIKNSKIKKAKNKWNNIDDIFLIENYYTKGVDYCSSFLNRSKQSIYHRIHKLKNNKINEDTKI